MGEHVGERAVVLGGGMAGLLAARVLSERYRTVVIVERDTIIGARGTRRGVPQAHHAHGLLARGQQILEDLFPGLLAELAADGVISGDLSGSIRWYFNGKRLQQKDSGLLSVSATRPELEEHVRARVVALPNVEVRERTVVRSLVATADRTRVTGVQVAGDGEPETVLADLVVDATGRGSRSPVWLEEFGYERPVEQKIKIDLAYTSRLFELDTDPFGADIAINPVASPANPRGGFLIKLPGNVALLSQTGLLGDHPPRDDQGFLEFAKTLDAPEVYRAVSTAKPVSEINGFRVPASVRRRFDQLRRFPDGLLVIGDGVCTFNPVYGQGMTIAAMEADQLGRHLDSGGGVRPLRFFAQIAPIIDVPWDISAGGDLAFPGVEGPRPLKVKMGNAYMAKLHAAATVDGRFTEAFFRAAGLVDPPSALMRPSLVLGVLRTARRARAVERLAPVTTIGRTPHDDADLAA